MTTERLHWVDGLRTVAIALVVAHHSLTGPIVRVLEQRGLGSLAPLLERTTAAGVELFFVISGIVLLRPYLRSRRNFKSGQYFRRRFERLWPTYFAGLCFSVLPLSLARYAPNTYSDANLPVIDFLGFIQHLPIVVFGRHDLFNGSWWSLSVEVIFYATLPLLLVVHRARPWNRVRLLALLAVSVVLAEWLARSVGFAIPSHISPVFTFGVYVPCFVLGTLLAYEDWSLPWSRVCLAFGLIGILTAAFVAPLNHNVAYGFLWAGFVGLASQSASLQRFLAHPWMVWMGERSYSLFLTHFSVFYLVTYVAAELGEERGLLYAAITRGVGIPAAVIVAMVLFQTIEVRFAHGLVTADKLWPWSKPEGASAD